MEKTIKAKFSNGVIRPLEALNVEEGKELMITISEVPSEPSKTLDALRRGREREAVMRRHKPSKPDVAILLSTNYFALPLVINFRKEEEAEIFCHKSQL